MKNPAAALITIGNLHTWRALTAGIKRTNESIKATLKKCNSSKEHAAFKLILNDYQEFLRTAERDRQNWIKIERGVGNTKHLQELVLGPHLEAAIKI